jgi:hypothetical protein
VDARPGGGTAVRIAHFSVQEYLESERILEHAAIFSVQRREANAEITSICLTYLLEPTLSRESIAEYPFALYAGKTWHKHFRDTGEGTHCAEHQALRLFRNSGANLRAGSRYGMVTGLVGSSLQDFHPPSWA